MSCGTVMLSHPFGLDTWVDFSHVDVVHDMHLWTYKGFHLLLSSVLFLLTLFLANHPTPSQDLKLSLLCGGMHSTAALQSLTALKTFPLSARRWCCLDCHKPSVTSCSNSPCRDARGQAVDFGNLGPVGLLDSGGASGMHHQVRAPA